MTTVVRFPLGEIVITGNASRRLATEAVLAGLRRHASGDWGNLCPEDAMANDEALKNGYRLLSVYGAMATVCIVSGSSRSGTVR